MTHDSFYLTKHCSYHSHPFRFPTIFVQVMQFFLLKSELIQVKKRFNFEREQSGNKAWTYITSYMLRQNIYKFYLYLHRIFKILGLFNLK